MPIQSSLPLTKKLLRGLSRERELMIWPRAAKSPYQSCPLITSQHRLLKVHRYSHHTRTKKQSYCIQDLFATFSSAPFKALGRSHVLHSASIFLERLLMLLSFSKEKGNSIKMSGKINKELMVNSDQTEVTLLMKENVSQHRVRYCPLQVQAFFQQRNAKHQGLCQTNLKDRRRRSASIAIISKSLAPFLTKKNPSHRDSSTTFIAAY